MLPPDLPLVDALPLLGGLVLHATESQRNQSVVRSLRRGDNLAAREALARAKQRSCLLTAERACCLCHKRMGTSVLVAYPDGKLAHYLCYKRAGPAGGGGGALLGEASTLSGGGLLSGGGGLSGGVAGLLPSPQGVAVGL